MNYTLSAQDFFFTSQKSRFCWKRAPLAVDSKMFSVITCCQICCYSSLTKGDDDLPINQSDSLTTSA